MTAKTYLKQHRRLKAKICRIEEAIEEARAAAAYPGINLNGMPRSASPRNSTEDKLIRLVSLEEELRDMMLEDAQTIYDIEETINAIENEEAAEILHLRYIKCLPFEAHYNEETIATATNYSTPHVYTLHREGLKEVQQILDNRIVS